MAQLGKRNRLVILRSAPPGVYLDGGRLGEILLPSKYVPPDAKLSGKIDVFVYRDSEDRLVATTRSPLAMAGEFAGLRVVSVNRRVGVFLDWGLEKDLLLPIREMAGPLNPGDRVLVQVLVDEESDRLIATARFNRRLDLTPPNYHPGESVRLLVASRTPLGYNMIVNDAHRGLLYRSDLAGPLEVGQRVEGYVRAIRPDGKIDLAPGRAGYRRIGEVSEKILAALTAAGGRLPFDDNSPPLQIRARFGVSKKAFKQAIGSLYRDRRIVIENRGIRLNPDQPDA
ncbi:MAG TPA: S1-like domain-containing RNA-binding protein [Lacunisphaera sp.]|nr:S1-like domain-containing RNA-binding protein [Lacunisphaera sp.]